HEQQQQQAVVYEQQCKDSSSSVWAAAAGCRCVAVQVAGVLQCMSSSSGSAVVLVAVYEQQCKDSSSSMQFSVVQPCHCLCSRIWTPHWLCKTIPPVMGNCKTNIKVYNRPSVLDRASCSIDVIPRGGMWLDSVRITTRPALAKHDRDVYMQRGYVAGGYHVCSISASPRGGGLAVTHWLWITARPALAKHDRDAYMQRGYTRRKVHEKS
ncbi:hypothetical protein HaLaN_32782, partial [Haematococcus lacustris]